MKGLLFELKKLYALVFSYPVARISNETIDYDLYWKDKRGSGLGALSRWQKQRADIALQYVRSSTNPTLLDVGCGDGSVLGYLRTEINAARTIGIDVSEEALAKAREAGIETVRADMSDRAQWKVVPEADYVLLFEVLEHLPESEAFLADMRLKANQGVFFSFPNTGYFAHRLRLLLGKFPMQWRLHPGEHLRFWTHADVRWWLQAQGYTDYKLHCYEGVPLLNRIWPSLFAAGLLVYLPKSESKK